MVDLLIGQCLTQNLQARIVQTSFQLLRLIPTLQYAKLKKKKKKKQTLQIAGKAKNFQLSNSISHNET